jgi:hypothetical protein
LIENRVRSAEFAAGNVGLIHGDASGFHLLKHLAGLFGARRAWRQLQQGRELAGGSSGILADGAVNAGLGASEVRGRQLLMELSAV